MRNGALRYTIDHPQRQDFIQDKYINLLFLITNTL